MKKNKRLESIVKKLVKSSFKNEKITESSVVRAIKFLKSLPGTESIYALSEFLKGLKREERQHTLVIETSGSLSSAQVKKMTKLVGEKINKVTIKINPEILGGVRLHLGDNIWDLSVLGYMTEVKEVIAHGRSFE